MLMRGGLCTGGLQRLQRLQVKMVLLLQRWLNIVDGYRIGSTAELHLLLELLLLHLMVHLLLMLMLVQ